jgi:transcription initiation factor TFIIIB Brf1 subunit/transcription initiation factor TFIIB
VTLPFIKEASSSAAEIIGKRSYQMTRIGRSVIAVVVAGLLIAGVSGCKKEGPMERTGKEIDKAAEKTGQQLNKAVEKTGEKIEKTGDKIKDSVK